MVVIAYVHDSTSIYDSFFLEHLTSKNIVYFLTFNQHPKFVNRASKRAMKKVNETVNWHSNSQILNALIAKLVKSKRKEELT